MMQDLDLYHFFLGCFADLFTISAVSYILLCLNNSRSTFDICVVSLFVCFKFIDETHLPF